MTLANAVGTGVADDKAVYSLCRGHDPVLPVGGTGSAQCPDPHLAARPTAITSWTICDELVVKAVNESGGYGMLMGPYASARSATNFRVKILANPRNYIAQPVVTLSTCPTWTEEGLAPRHVDLVPISSAVNQHGCCPAA